MTTCFWWKPHKNWMGVRHGGQTEKIRQDNNHRNNETDSVLKVLPQRKAEEGISDFCASNRNLSDEKTFLLPSLCKQRFFVGLVFSGKDENLTEIFVESLIFPICSQEKVNGKFGECNWNWVFDRFQFFSSDFSKTKVKWEITHQNKVVEIHKELKVPRKLNVQHFPAEKQISVEKQSRRVLDRNWYQLYIKTECFCYTLGKSRQKYEEAIGSHDVKV